MSMWLPCGFLAVPSPACDCIRSCIQETPNCSPRQGFSLEKTLGMTRQRLHGHQAYRPNGILPRCTTAAPRRLTHFSTLCTCIFLSTPKTPPTHTQAYNGRCNQRTQAAVQHQGTKADSSTLQHGKRCPGISLQQQVTSSQSLGRTTVLLRHHTIKNLPSASKDEHCTLGWWQAQVKTPNTTAILS